MPDKPMSGMPKPTPEVSAEKGEREKQLEKLAKIVQEHPEVLNEVTPRMLGLFAQYLETPSGDKFVTYERIDAKIGWSGKRSHRAQKRLQLWADKPKLSDDAFVDPGTSNALMKSEVSGPLPEEGLGGIEVISSETEVALGSLSRNLELINTEKVESIEDKAQVFLFTYRSRAKK